MIDIKLIRENPDLVKENIPQDAIDLFYKEEDPHRMFVGEVVEIIKK